MAYDEDLAQRVRTMIGKGSREIEEKKMFGGLCFMVRGKMCVCVRSESILVKLSPADYERTVTDGTLEPMLHIGRKMPGFGYVDLRLLSTAQQLSYWIKMALTFNAEHQSPKVKKKK